MSIINYCQKLRMFSTYEIDVVKLLTKEFIQKDGILTFDIDEILKQIQVYWYKDSNDDNLGGFSAIGKDSKMKKWSIYINDIFSTQQNFSQEQQDYSVVFNQINLVLGTVLHELTHYVQFKKNPLVYYVLQLPVLRDYTIQTQAKAVSDYVYNEPNLNKLNMIDELCLKIKYKINDFYLSKKQRQVKKYILENKIDYMNEIYHKCFSLNEIIKKNPV